MAVIRGQRSVCVRGIGEPFPETASAREVGGDFFQIIPYESNGSLQMLSKSRLIEDRLRILAGRRAIFPEHPWTTVSRDAAFQA